MSDERRADQRFATSGLGLLAFDSLSKELIGSVANLSASGLMLIGHCSAEVGGIIQLSLAKNAQRDEFLVELVVQVAWKTSALTAGSEWVGLHINDLSNKDARNLLGLLAEAEAIELIEAPD